MQIVRQPKVYDAIVVGSGAAGGMTALVLCQAGAKFLMLEAGANYVASEVVGITRSGSYHGGREGRKPCAF
jgi:choline dehydrogenase-like flavoprotein